MPMKQHVAYLSVGKVHLLDPGADQPRVFESKFGQQVRERAVSIQRRHSWKQKGRGAQFMSGGLLWGEGEEPEVLARGVLSFDLCDDGAVVYTNGAAIYRLDADGSRQRLHKGAQILQVAVLEPPPGT